MTLPDSVFAKGSYAQAGRALLITVEPIRGVDVTFPRYIRDERDREYLGTLLADVEVDKYRNNGYHLRNSTCIASGRDYIAGLCFSNNPAVYQAGFTNIPAGGTPGLNQRVKLRDIIATQETQVGFEIPKTRIR